MKKALFSFITLLVALSVVSFGLMEAIPFVRQAINAYLPWNQAQSQARSSATQPANAATARQTAFSKNCLRQNFQCGVIFPRWGNTAYGTPDGNWQLGLQEIKDETEARWLAITINLYQPSLGTPVVQTGAQTPSPQAIQEGIQSAKALGYKVFVEPLLTVEGPQSWNGSIYYLSPQKLQAWFASYWSILRPYALAAHDADEFSIGTEYERLQMESPASWLTLLKNVHSVYSGPLTYGLNWSSVMKGLLPSWLNSPLLRNVGVSTYFSLTAIPQRLNQDQAVTLWKTNVQSWLDNLARKIKKTVLINEIGYRNTSDAGYEPFVKDTQAARDDAEQAILYQAAMANIQKDANLCGVFFWAWSVPPFSPNGKLAAHVLAQWYGK